MNQSIYFDHAATTAVRKEVLEVILPYFSQMYGNASSVYSIARKSRNAIDKARDQVATALGAKPEEIYFTAGGTESDNWALVGVAESLKNKGNHIITTSIEHHAVLHTCDYLEERGFAITYLPVDEFGKISLTQLEEAIRPETILISVMFANNEIGTIEPIQAIGEIAKKHQIMFHTDAVQAVGHIPVDVNGFGIDLLSLSGHKLGAPKGVGALYIKKGTPIRSFLHGGGQERGRRAGTENVPGIVGLGMAIQLAQEEMEVTEKKLTFLRDKLIKGVLDSIPYARLNGHPKDRLPGNCNFSFDFIQGESLLVLLDEKGICASSGSACTSGSLDPSHVLLAIGLSHEKAHGSLRLTLGSDNKEEEIDYLLEILPHIVQRLREMSPACE